MQPVTKAERVQALVFLVGGLVLALGTAALLTGFPFEHATTSYVVEFNESVTGLETGSPVRYRGVKSGKVERIELAGDDRVRVVLAVKRDVRVTTATKARFASTGILGPYFIELYAVPQGGATPQALPEGAAIPADQSTMRRLIEGGTTLIEHLNGIGADLRKWTSDDTRGRVERLLEAAEKTLRDVDALVEEARPETVRLAARWADLGAELTAAVTENREAFRALLAEGAGAAARLKSLLDSGQVERTADEAQRLMSAAREEVRATGGALRTYLEQNPVAPLLERAVKSLERLETAAGAALGAVETETVAAARGDLAPALRSLRETARSLQELIAVLRNDPALLLLAEPRPEVRPPVPGEKK